MYRRSKKLIIIIMTTLLVSLGMAEQNDKTTVQPTHKITSDDFRLAVGTNHRVYHDKDVMILTVHILNNDSKPVFLLGRPNPGDDPNETGTIYEGTIDGKDVDVKINDRRKVVIGHASLKRLGPSPTPPSDSNTPDPNNSPKKLRLPLFGSRLVQPHSTRIISTANILIHNNRPNPDPNDSLENPEPLSDEPLEIIPGVGRHVALKPGYYLVDCVVDKIWSERPAKAQKIIEIRRARPLPQSFCTDSHEPIE